MELILYLSKTSHLHTNVMRLQLGWAAQTCRPTQNDVVEPCNTPRVSTTKKNAVSLLQTLPRAAKHPHSETD